MSIDALPDSADDDDVPRGAPLPFALQVVVAFCLLHAARAVGTASAGTWARVSAGTAVGTALLMDALPYALFVACDALLSSQVALRARNALFWGAVYFALLAVFGLRDVVIDVDRWAELAVSERVRAIASIAVDAAMVGAILSRPSRRALVR